MAVDVVMPRLSDSMEEGTVVRWLVAVGERVERDQPLVEVETDKANMTYDADTGGVLLRIVTPEGATAAIGEPIALIGEPGEEVAAFGDGAVPPSAGAGATAPDRAGAVAVTTKPGEAAEAAPPTRHGAPGGRIAASPVARRAAAALGLDLAGIAGSGPVGRILKADVERAARMRDGAFPRAPPAVDGGAAGVKGEVRVQELTRLQRAVARRMAESRATVPELELRVEVDMTGCVRLRRRLVEVADPAPSYNDMVVKAAALALREHPRVNGSYRDGRLELYERINVGVAVAAPDTLVVPTVFDADRKSLGEIARTARELAARVRDGSLSPPELAGGTFTVSNLGMYGIDSFSAVIDQPQAAILAVGSLKERPAAADGGRLVARPLVTLTLACDHRILYGADGARFLARVRELLERPLTLAL